MKFKPLHPSLFVSRQLYPDDLLTAAKTGFRRIICNRPDGEDPDQLATAEIAHAALGLGMDFVHLPISGDITEADVSAMEEAISDAGGPTLAYCRSGNRSVKLGALALASHVAPQRLLKNASLIGFELGGLTSRLAMRYLGCSAALPERYEVVVVGGGAAGIATSASLLKRRPDLKLAVVEPSEVHYYQPGWTMVGAGIFSLGSTMRKTGDVLPRGAVWIHAAVTGFEPAHNRIQLEDGRMVEYDALVVATGLALDWDAIAGLRSTLGRNGVTSNYKPELAPYTADLVRTLGAGRAIFTQPPMPIKCAGAPQKAMYLSCDAWREDGRLGAIDVRFHTATPALFGVAAYIPALMSYVSRYGIDLQLGSKLVAVDGDARTATFEKLDADGVPARVTEPFDMLHVCPPQVPPPAVARSPLAGAGGFVEVDPATLRHLVFKNVFAVGDVAATTNAKTAAAARKQAPVVAENVLATLAGDSLPSAYDGYGSCPLTVERGKIVLAEFGYGGVLIPSFPKWLLDGTKPTRLAWFLKARMLPALYWHAMLKGREWLARPKASS